MKRIVFIAFEVLLIAGVFVKVGLPTVKSNNYYAASERVKPIQKVDYFPKAKTIFLK